MPTARAALRLTDVRKSFVGVAALKGVSFEVRPGEVHALLGENGAGKSTLMAIAAGSLPPDEGSVEIAGRPMESASPRAAQELGLGVVYQHPAVLEDLTVAENLALAVPAERRPRLGPAASGWAREQLARIDADIDVDALGQDLSPAQRQLVEIAKALALDPQVLILDEPTAALNAAEVQSLFARVRNIRAAGTAIVYISHRIPEVIEIADRLTVLRDGEHKGTFPVAGISEDEILDLILGRRLEAVFPDKGSDRPREALLSVRGLSGDGFDHVDLDVRPGEILGLAGMEGNGQREALRALAGLGTADGEVTLHGVTVRLGSPLEAQRDGVFLVPGDRQREGVFAALSVRENIAISSLRRFARGGLVRAAAEQEAVATASSSMAVKAASPEADVATLSGGNQQKVVLARALLSEPTVLLCDEPTQGVDAGARVEIYRLLRRMAAEGKAVVVLSSDAIELEGLCDRVAVFSRGHVIATLTDTDVTEEKITGTAIRSTQARREHEPSSAAARSLRLLRGNLGPSVIIAAAILLLGIYTASRSDSYLSEINLQGALFLAAALMFVSMGQLVVIMTAGIDLSVGPLMALAVVVLSSHMVEGASAGGVLLGVVLLVAVGVAVGLTNGLLIRKARISPIIATLATFIVLQGIALLLRPAPSGIFADAYIADLEKNVGPIPIAFIVAVLFAFAAEYWLRRRRAGLAVRAVGSEETSAHRIGVDVDRTVIGAYVLCSLLTVVGGALLAAQVGIGDATVGQTYTLSSVTAVVLAGASIYGGRGSFLSALLGALLVTQIINATTFLELSQAWQYWLPGALILIGGGLFARARGVRLAALETA